MYRRPRHGRQNHRAADATDDKKMIRQQNCLEMISAPSLGLCELAYCHIRKVTASPIQVKHDFLSGGSSSMESKLLLRKIAALKGCAATASR